MTPDGAQVTPGERPDLFAEAGSARWPQTLDDETRLDWLQLIRSERVGPATFHDLLAQFGSAKAALGALPDLGKAARGRRLKVCPRARAEAEFEAARRAGIVYVTPGEPDYPPAMRHMPSPPPLLAVLGQPAVLRRPTVAIVGPRNASALGAKFAGQIARELSEAGLVVASGLARGVDGAAHAGSLEGGTVASLAGGLDRIYPPEHGDLARRITERGALISEMPLGHAPRAQDFPRRNRLIAGMSLGTLVVQAAMRSGS
ncbi:MAG: DNA-processing protein DprA, partial [Pseudomonadota bacterium]